MEGPLRHLGDVRNLLKRFGTFIYTGDRVGDLDLMEDELDELFEVGLLDRESWLSARGVLAKSRRRDGG